MDAIVVKIEVKETTHTPPSGVVHTDVMVIIITHKDGISSIPWSSDNGDSQYTKVVCLVPCKVVQKVETVVISNTTHLQQ